MISIFVLAFLAAAAGVIRPYINGARRVHFALAALVCFVLIAIAAPSAEDAPPSPPDQETSKGGESAPAIATTTEMKEVAAPAPEPEHWTYHERKDEMRGSVLKIASASAREPIRLDFPYGESTPQLNLRRDPKYGFDIYISANGQFLCRSYNDDTLSAKFDEGPIKDWACADADGGSSDIVFVRRAETFLSELKKARKVTIEVEMYNAGRQQMTFDVSGLNWK